MPPPPADLTFHRSRSPSFFQRLGSLDLFNNLLFNRERVYQSFKQFSSTRTNPVKVEEPARDWEIESEDPIVQSVEDEEEGQDMAARKSPRLSGKDRVIMALTKPRAKPRKRTPLGASPTRRVGTATAKKRSLSAANKSERASKVQKVVPKANTKKRVNGRGSSNLDAVVISDSEDDHSDLFRLNSLTPPRQTQRTDSPSSEDDLKPALTPTPTHSNYLETELARVKAAHERESSCLRLKLIASEAKVAGIKDSAAQEALELQRRQSAKSDEQLADRERKLETERKRSSDLSWECDHLRRELEAARSYLSGEANLVQQRDQYARLYKAEQDAHAVTMRGLEEKSQETTRKANRMADEMQQLATQVADLQREVNDLRNENAALRISALSTPPRSYSPAPSLSSSQSTTASDADLRLANMRKTYITVKRRYDNLHSVANNISTATRSWDYSGFGEFGQYLRQLKMAIDANGSEQQGLVSASHLAKVE